MKRPKTSSVLLILCLVFSHAGYANPHKKMFLCALACAGVTSLALQFTPLKELSPWNDFTEKRDKLKTEKIAAVRSFRNSFENRMEILIQVSKRTEKEYSTFQEPKEKLIEAPLRSGELLEINRIANAWLVEDSYLKEQEKVEAYFELAAREPSVHNIKMAHAARKTFLTKESWVIFYWLFTHEFSMTNSISEHAEELEQAFTFLREEAPHPLLFKN